MEMFNEVTNIVLTYHMMTFTDWVSDPKRRYTIGYSVIMCVIGNFMTHFFFLMRETSRVMKIKYRKRKYFKKIMHNAKKKEE